MQTVLTRTVHLTEPGVIDVDGAALQSFASIPQSWAFQLLIDGELVWGPAGTYPGDVVAIGGIKHCQAGDRTVELRWSGAPGVTLKERYLKIRGFNNTAG